MAAASFFALLMLFLAGCSSLGRHPVADWTTAGDGPAYLLTVDLAEGDTQEEIVERHGGEIEVWVDGEFAVLGFSAQAAQQRAAEFSLLGAGDGLEPNLQFSSNPNAIEMQGTSGLWAGGTSTLWAGGTSRIWAGGTSYLWAGGTSYLWAGGLFAWMPENTDTWKQIRLDEAHHLVSATLGRGVNVAVIDTGVDMEHPALRYALAPGYDFIDWDAHPDEEGSTADAGYGHGTNVAGIVRQVAPRATILPYRVLGPDGTGEASDLTAAIIAATLAGADVINLSLGGAAKMDSVNHALEFAMRMGVFVVASTGDSGSSFVTYPGSAADEHSRLVSLTSVDEHDRKSDFAPFHPTDVEMSSPGEFIYGPAPDLKAAAWSGTSMAAPTAAGALALAISAQREAGASQFDQSDLPRLLLGNSFDIDHLNPEWDGQLGSGRLDVARFVEAALAEANNHDRWSRNWDRWQRGYRHWGH